MVDEILITLHFHRAISADILVPIARMRVIEDIDTQVQDAIIEFFVCKNRLIHRPLGELAVEVLRRREMVGIQIPLAHREHVQKHQCGDGKSCRKPSAISRFGLPFFRFGIGPKYYQIGKYDQPERHHSIMGQKTLPVLLECCHKF